MAGHGLIHPCDQLLVFVVRKDGEPGLYLDEGVTSGQACLLLRMMADHLEHNPDAMSNRPGSTGQVSS